VKVNENNIKKRVFTVGIIIIKGRSVICSRTAVVNNRLHALKMGGDERDLYVKMESYSITTL